MKRIRRNNINRRGCFACKSRNKQCDIGPTKERCSYCSKKGIECNIPSLNIIKYEGPHKSTRKQNAKQKFTHAELDDSRTVKKILDPLVETEHENLNQIITNDIIGNYLECASHKYNGDVSPPATIRSNGMFYIYEKKLIFSESFEERILVERIHKIPLINDNTSFEKRTRDIYRLEELQVSDIVNRVPLYDKEYKKIGRRARLELKFSEHENSCKTSQSFEMNVPQKTELLDIDMSNLKNEFFMEAPSLINGRGENQKICNEILACFVNLPSYIPIKLTKLLFTNFCQKFPQETNKVLYATSNRNSVSCKEFTRLVLNVYLSLAFSNTTVFKAIILWSASFIKLNHGSPEYSKTSVADLAFLGILHDEIIRELNNRGNFISAVCCDHTIAICLILLELENFKSEVCPSYWFKLTTLTIKVISLRGGFEKLCETENGFFFAKVFSSHFFTHLGYNSLKHNIHCLNIEDMHSIYKILAASNLNLYYRCMKEICSIVGETLHLYNLMKIAKRAGDLNGDIQMYNYQLFNSCNISKVLDEARDLKNRLADIRMPENECEEMIIDFLTMRKLASFVKESTFLLLFQLLYNNSSTSTLTVLQVTKMIPMLQGIFDLYKNDYEGDVCIFLILPIFTIGCDIVGHHYRTWFIENLKSIYLVKKQEKFLTIMKLVEKVWLENENGTKFVLWPEIAEEAGFTLPLYV
ncbi:uncharacterized protein PRCAT00005034001 [Priceomyces carsonii]|uniref:uncharacterized protein n=1 Tax=Priceomyces carsonii TaxID=28549 RepID=UPI002ED902EA|nr:unnamed protein product [Priceomyces carsonii]